MRENNENLLAVTWWVILNSPDLFIFVLEENKLNKLWKNNVYLVDFKYLLEDWKSFQSCLIL